MRELTGGALDVLFDDVDAPAMPLPDELAARYGGPLRLRERCVISNFVASLDGVVTLRADDRNSGSAISQHNHADRFVMALLRACASAVLIGAGTLRATPKHEWTADALQPDWTPLVAAMRARMGIPPRPHLYVLSGRGDVDRGHVALQHDATILTTASGAHALHGCAAAVRVLGGEGAVDMHAVIGSIHDDGHGIVLTEGGPHVMGGLLRMELLDEMFLTLSPRAFGRDQSLTRLGMVEGVAYAPSDAPRFALRGVRRDDSYVFLRYGSAA